MAKRKVGAAKAGARQSSCKSVESAYKIARESFAAFGVDTDKAIR